VWLKYYHWIYSQGFDGCAKIRLMQGGTAFIFIKYCISQKFVQFYIANHDIS
jgi:hypothetical protein